MWTTIKRIEGLKELLPRWNELGKCNEVLIVIGGGMLQYATFVETANLGIATLLIDGSEECYCRTLCNHFIRVSTKEPFKINYKVKQFILEHPELKIIGVYTQGADVAFSVACLAEDLGLPSVSSKAARSCTNKIESRILFTQNYIPQPVFFYADNAEKAGQFADKLGYPCVFKAVDNCASRGLTIVRSKEQVEQAFETAISNSIDQQVIIEQFIEGDEYSVDTIVYKGKLYPCGISDREFLAKDEYAVQCGSLTPSLLPMEKQAEIYNVMDNAAKVLGVDNSAFKGDIIIDRQGEVKVLEVTARLSGGFDSQYRKPLSYGINLIKATIDLSLGRGLNFLDIIPKWVKWSKTFTVWPKPGVIKDIQGLDEVGHIKNVQGIKKLFWAKHIGDTVKDYRHCADRVVHIIGYADTYDQLNDVQRQVYETLKVVTE